jgi:uncharacterized membrane protein
VSTPIEPAGPPDPIEPVRPPDPRESPQAPGQAEAPQPAAGTQFEDYPLTRSEYIGAMVHFYRGELGRADHWRARLDPTTNWAIVTTGAMLSFAFSTPEHSHVTLLLALLLVSIFLWFEARRFRYFDVWRSRVRMIEENFWIPIIRRNLVSPRANWGEFVAEDLDCPTFKLSVLEAIGIRLHRNYLWIYFAILVAWLAKIHIHPTPARNFAELLDRMAIGPISGWLVLAVILLLYGGAVWMAFRVAHKRAAIDEVSGLEKHPGSWKT